MTQSAQRSAVHYDPIGFTLHYLPSISPPFLPPSLPISLSLPHSTLSLSLCAVLPLLSSTGFVAGRVAPSKWICKAFLGARNRNELCTGNCVLSPPMSPRWPAWCVPVYLVLTALMCLVGPKQERTDPDISCYGIITASLAVGRLLGTYLRHPSFNHCHK